MAPGPGLCEECGRPAHERVETITGRLVCRPCSEDLLDAAGLAMMGGDGIGDAVAVHGWLKRIRRLRPGSR